VKATSSHLPPSCGRQAAHGVLAPRKVASVAYETVELPDHRLPLLRADERDRGAHGAARGRQYLRASARWSRSPDGWGGGVAPARVVVLGAGMAGLNAAWIAAGMEADVVVLDKNVDRLRYIDQIQRGRIQTVMSSGLAVEQLAVEATWSSRRADPGGEGAAPGDRGHRAEDATGVGDRRYLDRPGRLRRDRARDHPFEPVYVEHDVVHYCVGNMPGAVRGPRRTPSRT